MFADSNNTKAEDCRKWFVMRDLTRPNAKRPAYIMLEELNVRCFTPMVWKTITKNGTRKTVRVPVMHDLLFVNECRKVLDPIVAKTETLQYRFLRNAWRVPMTVRDEEMERFIAVSESSGPVRYYTPEEITPGMRGSRIRIVGGQMDGYEGTLVTVRGSKTRRLLVEISSLIAVTAEIDADYIVLIDNK